MNRRDELLIHLLRYLVKKKSISFGFSLGVVLLEKYLLKITFATQLRYIQEVTPVTPVLHCTRADPTPARPTASRHSPCQVYGPLVLIVLQCCLYDVYFQRTFNESA